MRPLHPWRGFRPLNMDLRGKSGLIFQCSRLNIDHSRKSSGIAIEKARATIGTEMPRDIFRRTIFLGLAPHLDLILWEESPSDHRRASTPAAVCTMA